MLQALKLNSENRKTSKNKAWLDFRPIKWITLFIVILTRGQITKPNKKYLPVMTTLFLPSLTRDQLIGQYVVCVANC